MIPPMIVSRAAAILAPLGAKLASPLVKWALVGAIIIGTNVWTWHRATLSGEQAQAKAVAEQAQEYARQTAQITTSREEVLKQLDTVRREKDQKIIDIQKRLVTYVHNAKKTDILAPPDSVGMFNTIGSLLPPKNTVSSSDPSTREPHESPETRIEVTRLLLAYVAAYADCGGELKSLWDDYEALVTVLRHEYTIKKDGD